MSTSPDHVVVDDESDEDFVSDWFEWSGPLVAIVQGDWGAATAIRLVGRPVGFDVIAGNYAPAATFTPDSDRRIEVVFSGRSLPPLTLEYRWEVDGNDGSEQLQLVHMRC